jgi:hypothetical protein
VGASCGGCDKAEIDSLQATLPISIVFNGQLCTNLHGDGESESENSKFAIKCSHGQRCFNSVTTCCDEHTAEDLHGDEFLPTSPKIDEHLMLGDDFPDTAGTVVDTSSE